MNSHSSPNPWSTLLKVAVAAIVVAGLLYWLSTESGQEAIGHLKGLWHDIFGPKEAKPDPKFPPPRRLW